MYRMVQFIFVLVLFMFTGVYPALAVERPFNLTGAGRIEFSTDGSGELTASGTATHLGKWNQSGQLNFTPNPDNPSVILANGESTFTAADGDTLEALIDNGELDTATGIATGMFVFKGGTGRFDEATGSADFTVTQDLDSGEFEVTANGTIDF